MNKFFSFVSRAFWTVVDGAKKVVSYVREHRQEFKEKAQQVAQKAYEVVIAIARKLVATYQQAAVVADLTWNNRIDQSFLQALKQAIAEVKTMKGDEVANYAIAIIAPQVQA